MEKDSAFLPSMDRQVLDSLDDASLVWACIEPTIQQIRGKNAAIKADAYANLSTGQQALLMFQILHGHSSSGVMEFYRLIPYLPSQQGIWSELKKAMRYFQAESMLQLLEEMEREYSALAEQGTRHLEDRIFFETIADGMKCIAAFIRNNTTEFFWFNAV